MTTRNFMIMIKEILNNEINLEYINDSNEENYEITP